MARHKHDYCGEPFTEFVGFKCTSEQRRELVAAAGRQSVSISEFAREVLLAYLRNAPVALPTHRALEIEAKMRVATNATHAVNGLRSLMNQIARHVNSVQELGPHDADLREAIGHCERVAEALLDATVELTAA